jgi:hypothetical protein
MSNAHVEWEEIERVLPAGWRDLAKELKLVRKFPPHMGTKVTEISEVLRLVLYMVATNSALVVASGTFAAAGLLTLSSVSLHKWMRRLGPYLGELLARMVACEHAAFAPERWAGYVPVLVDATVVNNPGSKGVTVRVHKGLRLCDLRVLQAVVADVKTGETFRNFTPRKGELYLGDRVYANPPGIAWIKAHDADALVRFNRGALPLYDAAGTPMDVFGKLAKLAKPGQPREWQVFVHADGIRIQGRLVTVRLPKDKAEEARVRARKEQGTSVTEETLRMAEFVVVFTTVPKERLGTELILELYRLRWLLELEFKRDKSITGLDRLPNFRPDTIESWIYAKLLLHQIARKLAASLGDFPPSAIGDAALRVYRDAA